MSENDRELAPCVQMAKVTHILIYQTPPPPGPYGFKEWQIWFRLDEMVSIKLEFLSGYSSLHGYRGKATISPESYLRTPDVPEGLQLPLLIPVNVRILYHLINTVDRAPYTCEIVAGVGTDAWCIFTILSDMEEIGLLEIATAAEAWYTMTKLARPNPQKLQTSS